MLAAVYLMFAFAIGICISIGSWRGNGREGTLPGKAAFLLAMFLALPIWGRLADAFWTTAGCSPLTVGKRSEKMDADMGTPPY